MKKSRFIKLVLITAALASCNRPQKENEWASGSRKKVYMRSDSTASYTRRPNNSWLWYYAFRPYGYYSRGQYYRQGYFSRGINEESNVGRNSFKSSAVTRGGFGHSSAGGGAGSHSVSRGGFGGHASSSS